MSYNTIELVAVVLLLGSIVAWNPGPGSAAGAGAAERCARAVAGNADSVTVGSAVFRDTAAVLAPCSPCATAAWIPGVRGHGSCRAICRRLRESRQGREILRCCYEH